MPALPNTEGPTGTLRAAAEAQLKASTTGEQTHSAEKLLHELQVHQIELEMQNQALRQTQAELEESRQRYVDLYDFAPVGYLSLSENGKISEINLTGATLLGEDRSQLLERRFSSFVAATDQPGWRQHFLHSLQHPDQQTCDLSLQRSNGTRFDARLHCLSHTTVGAAPSLRLTLTDITKLKQAEDELRIAAITFESQEGMLVTDPQGVIVRVNRAFTRLTGYEAQEAIGQRPSLLRSGRHDPGFYQHMWQELKDHGYWQGEMWNQRKNGKIFAEWLTISAVLGPDGVPTHYVGTFSEITQNKEAEAEIHRLAYYDPLTHLPNRRLFHDRLSQGIASSNRSGNFGALLFLDLDNFKNLNDTLGHDIGDLLLIETGRRLQACVRGGDMVARLGGDEFVVMLENLGTEVKEAAILTRVVGEKIREALTEPYPIQERQLHCTTSIGIALFCNLDEPAETLLRHADMAMYKAKNAGRNTLRFFDPAMQVALDERSALEADLRLALELGQLHLYYQPQVDETRRLVGAEALLRWQHPQRGLVLPGDFIPLAEETGLILPIGQWVLEIACAQIKTWSTAPATRDLQLAVNVSTRQFRQADFVERIEELLTRTGIDPTRLKIELTESLVIDNVADTIAHMQAIKALGVQFSMDDFGTGFSSLSYLKRLPLNQLKIDRSFVIDIISNAHDAAIVQTIISMGKTLGLHVIAEGVETESQLNCLTQYGCTAFQGFLFSRPLTLADFEEFAQRRVPTH